MTTWLAVYPTLLVISTAVRFVGGVLPMPSQLAISSLLLTAVLTWLITPRLTRRLRLWLIDTGPDDGARVR